MSGQARSLTSTATVSLFAGSATAQLVPLHPFADNGQLNLNLGFTIPNDPSLVGTYAFQGLSGDGFRGQLSNVALLQVTPYGLRIEP